MDDDYDQDFSLLYNETDSKETETKEIIIHYIFYLVPPLFILVDIVGMIGNCSLIYILIKANTKRNASTIYLLNLAVADLMVLLFYLPFNNIYLFFKNHWIFGEVLCHVTHSFNKFAWGASAFTLTALSAHTCSKETTSTPTLQSRREKRNAIVTVALIWGLSVVFAFPTMMFTHVQETFDRTEGYMKVCLGHRGHELIIHMLSSQLAMFYLIPLTAASCFLVVARRKSHCLEHEEYLKLVTVLIAVYALCFLPIHLASIRVFFNLEYNQFWADLNIVGNCLVLGYRCLNPVVLCYVDSSIRQLATRHLLFRRRNERNLEEAGDELELPLRDAIQECED